MSGSTFSLDQIINQQQQINQLLGSIQQAIVAFTAALSEAGIGVPVTGLTDIANDTVLGNVSGVTALPVALDQAQLTSLINAFTPSLSGSVPAGAQSGQVLGSNGWQSESAGGDVPIFSGSSPGLVPASDGSLTLYLNGGGVWSPIQPFGTVDVRGPISLYQNTSIGNAIVSYNEMRVIGTTQSTTAWENAVSVQLNNTVGGSNPKVGLYSAIGASGASCGPGWAGNLVNILNSGCNMSVAHQALELDFNNSSGTDSGDSGFGVGPLTAGLQLSGVGTNRLMCAECILGNVTGGLPLWNYGLVASNNSIATTFITDFTSSATSIDIRGSHGVGIDLSNGSSTIPIKLAAASPITASGLSLIEGSGSAVILGASGASSVVSGAEVIPNADNAYTCGASGARWSAVWAATGTIQTSDPSLKEDIRPLPPMADMVRAIEPITFRWKDGKRTHWGFSALDVKEAFDGLGMDFGGYVLAEDGTHCMRPDQMIPVLWKAVQEISDEVRAMKEV